MSLNLSQEENVIRTRSLLGDDPQAKTNVGAQIRAGMTGGSALRGFIASDRSSKATAIALPHLYEVIPNTNIPRMQTVEIDPTALEFDTETYEKQGGGTQTKLMGFNFDGQYFRTSNRFLYSLCGLLGQSTSVFNLFSPEEIVIRAMENKQLKEKIKLSYASQITGGMEAFAATTLKTVPFSTDAIMAAFGAANVNPMNVAFDNGEVVSLHDPAVQQLFKAAGDDMAGKFILSVPLDGYGDPSSYLAIVRVICTNLNIWYTKAFRSKVQCGKKDPASAMGRFIGAFSNEEGFLSIQNRIETARTTYASINEVLDVYESFLRAWGHNANEEPRAARHRVKERFLSLIRGGDNEPSLQQVYGVANLNSLPKKTLSRLNAKCSVYDLLNFTTEYATHIVGDEGNRRLIQSQIAGLVANAGGLDLEGAAGPAEDAPVRPVWFEELGAPTITEQLPELV